MTSLHNISRNSAVALLLLTSVCWGCKQSPPPNPQKSEQAKRVGILLLTSHPVIQDLRDGFRQHLDDLARSKGISIAYDEKNADANAATLNQLVSYFSSGNHDLVYALGSDSVLKMKTQGSSVPVIFAGTPDPVRNGFVSSLEKPESTLTGVRFLPPANIILDILAKRYPKSRRIAVLRNPGEMNSRSVAEPFIEAGTARGLVMGDFGVTETTQLTAALGKIRSERWDVVFVPTDNLIYQNLKLVASSLHSSQIPFVSVTDASIKAGAAFAIGVSYLEMGRQAATVAATILFEGKKPTQIPVQDMRQGHMFVASDRAAEFAPLASPEFPLTVVK